MIDSSALLADLKAQLRVLQADLKERAGDPTTAWGAALQREHAEALRRERTGLSWTAWRDNEVDQAAVAWIVATTFIRFCEDNDLLVGATLDGMPVPVCWIAGHGDRTARARENQTAYFRLHTSHHDRDWLQQAFRVLAAQPAGAGLIDPQHNPVWTAEISAEAATSLLNFWRRTDEAGALVHDFTDRDLETRFLGDLYQELSEHAKKTYALLQTPIFVEEFILDRTLTPAIAEFGIDGLKLIDPTCGSGHFLLGAFARLNQQWAAAAPGMDPKQRVRRAMESIHGIDLNPFAVAIARFRLTVAGILAAGEKSLVGIPELGFHLAIGDSLLGEQGGGVGLFGDDVTYTYDTEDVSEYADILKPGRYHVVVGNPPYITVKDQTLNQAYRRAYTTAAGTYALSVPFMELFFRLAIRASRGQSAGYVGKITSNSFMKRGYGRRLVEEFFGGYHLDNPSDLTYIIDSSGAWMPGHNFDGTPTVILIGRRRQHAKSSVRVVMSVKDDPGRREDPSTGPVWTEIAAHVEDPGFDGEWISVDDVPRERFASHPWALAGGGSSELHAALSATSRKLRDLTSGAIGRGARIGADDAFVRPRRRLALFESAERLRPWLEGADLRDYLATPSEFVWLPYASGERTKGRLDDELWRWRRVLEMRATFQGVMADAGREWWEFMQFTPSAYESPLSIAFPNIASHNHFVLIRGDEVFSAHSPVVKLPERATERDYEDLLGFLNTSAVCFWYKQVSQKKGGDADLSWMRTYEYTGSNLQDLPVPPGFERASGAALDRLARKVASVAPNATLANFLEGGATSDLADVLHDARIAWDKARRQLCFVQEEADWVVYRAFGLVEGDVTYQGDEIAEIELGNRAFEIDLARRVARDEAGTDWFERNGGTRTESIPEEWPDGYREVVSRRLTLIAGRRDIRMLEKPDYKRRWAGWDSWEVQLKGALGNALLDILEGDELWFDPQGPTARSVAQLADLVRRDPRVVQLARALSGVQEPDLVRVIMVLVANQVVPYCTAFRFTPSGVERFREWQQAWESQRRQDAEEPVTVPIPPKFASSDYQKLDYWKLRGKFDVPKERFVSYPGVGREGDVTPVLGLARWNHRHQAVALVREVMNQQALGVSNDALAPMVAGLVELEPWLHQWHTDLEPEFGSSAALAVTSQIDQFLAQLQLTRDDVIAWRPPGAVRGRRSRT